MRRGDRAAAEALFAQALATRPADVMALSYLGVLAEEAGRLEDAERRFTAAAAAAPASPAARNNRGAILLRLGRVEEAMGEFEASLRLNPRQPSALVNLAQIRFASGTPEGLRAAQELFDSAFSLSPDTEIARSRLVVALRRGDRAGAATRFRDYRGQTERAGAPGPTASPREELGLSLLAAGLFAEAALELEAAVAGGADSARVHATLAELHESSGSFEKAIPAMRLAIERDPRNESYRFRYGMLLLRAKAPAAALLRLDEAARDFPGSALLSFALGLAHFSDHKNEEAARAFERAIELDPKFAPALAYRGMTLVALGRYEEALQYYDRALALDGGMAVGHYLAGDAHLKRTPPDFPAAERHLSRAIALNAAFAPARLALAKVYLQSDRFTEAAAELERVVAQEPRLAEAHYQLGRAYMRLRRNAEAQQRMAAFQKLSDAQREEAVTERQELVRRLADIRF